MDFNREKKLLNKFDFFKKPKDKNPKGDMVIYGVFSLAFLMGFFTNLSNSWIALCYISGVIFAIKGALTFNTSAENVPLKAPLIYLMIAAALCMLPDMMGGTQYIAGQGYTPSLALYETIPAAPLVGMP